MPTWVYRRPAPHPRRRVRTVFLDPASATLQTGQATYVLEVDWDNDGDFSDASENVTADTLTIETRRGRGTPDWVLSKAEPGTLVAVLKNTSGTYSPLNIFSPIAGLLAPGRKVRLRTTAPVVATLWTGYLDSVRPIAPSPGGVPTAELRATGPLGKIAKAAIEVAVNSGALTSSQVTAILDNIGWPAADREIQTGTVTTGSWPVGNTTDVVAPKVPVPDALEALRQLEDTELGFLYELADGKICFDSWFGRQNIPRQYTSQATFSDAPGATLGYATIEEENGLDGVRNNIITQGGAGTVTALAEVWSQNPISPATIPAGGYAVFTAVYPQPGDSAGLYVDAWTTPVVGVDITHTGGTLTVVGVNSRAGTVVKTPNEMRFAIVNTHPTDTATLTKVAARGTAVSRTDITKEYAVDTSSESVFGRRTLEWPAPFYRNAEDAKMAAAELLDRRRGASERLRITIPANRSFAVMAQCLQREISDLITVTANNSTKLGINTVGFWIEAISHRIDMGGKRHITTFELHQRWSPSVGAFDAETPP